MTDEDQGLEVERQLIQWAQTRSSVRAVLLTNSRANPNAPLDELSDYDIILVVDDIHPFYKDRSWLQDFGPVLVVYWGPIHRTPDYRIEQVANITQYADGLKIDFILWPVGLFQQIASAPTLPAELDSGYTVLVDKDRLADGMLAPTFTAYIPSPPSNETYQTVIENFFSHVPYVAKCLARDELLPAKWCLDYDMKHNFLRQMLEWRIQQDHDWTLPAGALGKGLKQQLSSDLWFQLERTYVGPGIEENWDALFKTVTLFRQVAIGVANHLGYIYPQDLDERVIAYVQVMRERTEN